MTPYWILFSVLGLGALASGDRGDWRRRGALLFLSAGLGITLMIGLRYQVGGDWGAYERMFRYLGDGSFSDSLVSGSAEPAYGALNWLVSRVGLGVWAVNVVCAAIFSFGLIRFVRRQPQPWLGLVVATPFLIVVVGMGYTRQSVAVGFFMLALTALADRSFLRAVLLILIGATFHRSILVTLPFLALSYARNRFQVSMLVIVAGLLGYFLLLAPELERYSNAYLEQEYQSQGAWIRLLMNAVPAAIFLVMSKRFALDPIDRILWRNLSLLALISFAAFYFTTATVALDRLALYIIPLQVFVLSRTPHIFESNKGNLIFISFLIVTYSAAVMFVWLNYAFHAEYWVPYQTIMGT